MAGTRSFFLYAEDANRLVLSSSALNERSECPTNYV